MKIKNQTLNYNFDKINRTESIQNAKIITSKEKSILFVYQLLIAHNWHNVLLRCASLLQFLAFLLPVGMLVCIVLKSLLTTILFYYTKF